MPTWTKLPENNVAGKLEGAISDSDTDLVLESGQGADFPASGNFYCTLHTADPNDANEIVLVTSRSTDTLTVTRAQQGTTAIAWADGTLVVMALTKTNLSEIQDAIFWEPGTSNSIYYTAGNVGVGVANPTRALQIEKDGGNGSVTLWCKNTGASSGDNARQYLQVGSGTSGDAFSVYAVSGGSVWSIGLDNSDSDNFKIARQTGFDSGNIFGVINQSGNWAVGPNASLSPDTALDVSGALTLREKSADPSDPDEGSCALWMSDGTGSGDDGDIMIKITAGATTKTVTLVDFSAS